MVHMWRDSRTMLIVSLQGGLLSAWRGEQGIDFLFIVSIPFGLYNVFVLPIQKGK